MLSLSLSLSFSLSHSVSCWVMQCYKYIIQMLDNQEMQEDRSGSILLSLFWRNHASLTFSLIAQCGSGLGKPSTWPPIGSLLAVAGFPLCSKNTYPHRPPRSPAACTLCFSSRDRLESYIPLSTNRDCGWGHQWFFSHAPRLPHTEHCSNMAPPPWPSSLQDPYKFCRIFWQLFLGLSDLLLSVLKLLIVKICFNGQDATFVFLLVLSLSVSLYCNNSYLV